MFIIFLGIYGNHNIHGILGGHGVFGVHGIGGIVGAILTGIFIREGHDNYAMAGMEQVVIQVKAVGVTIVWSAVASVIALSVAKYTVGLRVDEGDEETGLDQSSHGESAYN